MENKGEVFFFSFFSNNIKKSDNTGSLRLILKKVRQPFNKSFKSTPRVNLPNITFQTQSLIQITHKGIKWVFIQLRKIDIVNNLFLEKVWYFFYKLCFFCQWLYVRNKHYRLFLVLDQMNPLLNFFMTWLQIRTVEY